MASNIILLKRATGQGQLIPPGVVAQFDASGFDTVTARYIQQGTAAAVGALNLPGKAVTCPIGSATSMFFMGMSDAADLPGNHCEYTLTWRGIMAIVPFRDKKITQTRSVRERYFESLTPTTGAAFPANSKVRLMEQQAGASIRSIHTQAPSAPTAAQPSLEGVPTPTNQYKVSGAPITYVFPSGWICYSWQAEQPIPGIWFVSAEYKYEFPQQSG